jgi:hypothetical protein
VIDFGEGPTHEQVHELFQETTVLLTMLTHPVVGDEADAAQQAERTYALSPPYSLVVLASIGAGRFWRMARVDDAHRGLSAQQRFPRDVLQTVPSQGRPDLLLLAIDLIEEVARGGRARPLVDQLLVDGARAYRELLAVVHELGWLAAHADPGLKTLAELVALEAVTAEQDWYAHQQGG